MNTLRRRRAPRDVDRLTDSTFNTLGRDIMRQIREEAGRPGGAH